MKLSDYNDKKPKTDEKTVRLLRSFLKDHEGKSEDQLIASILAVATEKRKQGTLSDGELDAFAKMIVPSLNDEQKAKLDEVIKKLKAM